MEKKGFSRRGFLARLAGAAAALPLLSLLPEKASAAVAATPGTAPVQEVSTTAAAGQIWRAMW